MPVDANIFQQYLRAPKSVMEYTQDADEAQGRKNALQLAAMDLSEKTQANQRAQSVRNSLMSLGGSATDEQRINALRSTATPEGFSAADALEKSLLERQKTGAQVKKDTATADGETFKTRVAKSDQALKDIAGFQSPQEALASLQAHEAAGDVAPDKAQMIRQTLPQDPTKFAAWQVSMLRNIMSAAEQMKLQQTKEIADNNNKTQITTTRMNNATSRENNRDTITSHLQVAGVAPGGGVDENSERTAQAIASGQLPAPTGMALLNPKNQRILGRVMEINPQYDATTVDAKRKAARDFTSGSQGNSMRSFAVAGQHLDQLGTLVDALDNGNIQLVNKLGNAFSQQTGSPAVTNFDAAKDVVSKEVVKAIVAGGGGVSEREELSKLMANANSPAQLKGVIKQYRSLMSAQHDALLTQRRAAGLPDSTIPDYGTTAGTPAEATVPADIAAILKKHGGK